MNMAWLTIILLKNFDKHYSGFFFPVAIRQIGLLTNAFQSNVTSTWTNSQFNYINMFTQELF